VRVFHDERGKTATHFCQKATWFFAGDGIKVEGVMTDCARSFRTSHHNQAALRQLGATFPHADPIARRPTGRPSDSSRP